jgi:hypothetical protein
MFGQESLLPGISDQLALGGILVAIALYFLYYVGLFWFVSPINPNDYPDINHDRYSLHQRHTRNPWRPANHWPPP